MTATLLARARDESGLTQSEVARRAGTSRPTLSAYEHGRTSPTLDTAQRVLAATGHELEAVPVVTFAERVSRRGRVFAVPDRLWRLPVSRALGTITLPLHVSWSEPGRVSHLADRARRARVYEALLREGRPADIGAYVDGALLVDLWEELVVPQDIRAAWAPVIGAALDGDR
jgi:transcriptional regulator with XRE-family HTH domain